MDKVLISSLNEALKAEIESVKQTKPLKLHNLIRREGGLYVCTTPLKLDCEGVIRIGSNEFSVTAQSSNGIASISGMEDCQHESIKEALLFQDQTALLQKIATEFEAFKPSPLCAKLFEEKKFVTSPQSIYKNENLNEAQCDSVTRALEDEYLFVVGPAGTGKTKTIISLLTELLKNNKRVLVASHAHLAVENVFEDIVKKHPLEEGELVLQIRTELESLKKYSPKALSEEKAKSVKDELEMLEPVLKKLIALKSELQTKIEPADKLIASNQAFANNTDRQIRIGENQLLGLRDEKIGLEKRLKKLENNGFLASLSHLISNDKKDELLLFVDGVSLKIESKDKEVVELKAKAEEFQKEASKQMEDIKSAKSNLATVNEESKRVKERIEVLKNELADIINQDLFKSAKLAGCTLMSAAINKRVKEAKFDVLIVDEASMASLPMLLLAVNGIAEKVIFFGDPIQLSPVARTKELKKSIFDVLGISESFREGELHPKASMLDTQYRCHPEIACLTSKLFYGGLLKNGRIVASEKRAMYIKNTNGLGANFKYENGSFVNERHQRIVIDQVRSALQKGQRSIGVISPFKAQAEAIQSLYNLELAMDYPDADFKAATIHSFQGQEKDIVIFDFTFGPSPRGNGLPQSLLGDIASEAAKLLNVATTRAKDFFVLVCDLQYTHRIANTLPNCEEQIVVRWLKAIEEIAFHKNVESTKEAD